MAAGAQWLKCQFHAHIDGDLSTQEVLDGYADAGYDAVGIVGHRRWAAATSDRIIVISGYEDQSVVPPRSHFVILKAPHESVRILAHPRWPQLTPAQFVKAMANCDAWEIWNSVCGGGADASRYAGLTGKPGLAADDTHLVSDIGRTATFVYAERNADSIVAAVRAGRVCPAVIPSAQSAAAAKP